MPETRGPRDMFALWWGVMMMMMMMKVMITVQVGLRPVRLVIMLMIV